MWTCDFSLIFLARWDVWLNFYFKLLFWAHWTFSLLWKNILNEHLPLTGICANESPSLGMRVTMPFPLEERRVPSWLTPRRPSSTRRGPRSARRSTRRGKRTPRSNRDSLTSSWQVVFWLQSPPDLVNVADQTDMFLRERSSSSTSGRSRPRRENKLNLPSNVIMPLNFVIVTTILAL